MAEVGVRADGSPSLAVPAAFAYDAFISYRRRDGSEVARWLRGRLQRFRLPAEVLAVLRPEMRALHERRPRIWLDRAYEKASDDFLIRKVYPALDASARLIVVATPSVAETVPGPGGEPQPNWVLREIDRFLDMPGAASVERPVDVVRGPGVSDLAPIGRLAAKERRDWVDLSAFTRRRSWGFSEHLDDGLTKLIASLYDVPQVMLPDLRREEQCRRRRKTATVAVVLLFVVALAMLAAYQWRMRYIFEINSRAHNMWSELSYDFTPNKNDIDTFWKLTKETRNVKHVFLEQSINSTTLLQKLVIRFGPLLNVLNHRTDSSVQRLATDLLLRAYSSIRDSRALNSLPYAAAQLPTTPLSSDVDAISTLLLAEVLSRPSDVIRLDIINAIISLQAWTSRSYKYSFLNNIFHMLPEQKFDTFEVRSITTLTKYLIDYTNTDEMMAIIPSVIENIKVSIERHSEYASIGIAALTGIINRMSAEQLDLHFELFNNSFAQIFTINMMCARIEAARSYDQKGLNDDAKRLIEPFVAQINANASNPQGLLTLSQCFPAPMSDYDKKYILANVINSLPRRAESITSLVNIISNLNVRLTNSQVSSLIEMIKKTINVHLEPTAADSLQQLAKNIEPYISAEQKHTLLVTITNTEKLNLVSSVIMHLNEAATSICCQNSDDEILFNEYKNYLLDKIMKADESFDLKFYSSGIKLFTSKMLQERRLTVLDHILQQLNHQRFSTQIDDVVAAISNLDVTLSDEHARILIDKILDLLEGSTDHNTHSDIASTIKRLIPIISYKYRRLITPIILAEIAKATEGSEAIAWIDALSAMMVEPLDIESRRILINVMSYPNSMLVDTAAFWSHRDFTAFLVLRKRFGLNITEDEQGQLVQPGDLHEAILAYRRADTQPP